MIKGWTIRLRNCEHQCETVRQCWYILIVTEKSQSRHAIASSQFIHFALYSHFSRTCLLHSRHRLRAKREITQSIFSSSPVCVCGKILFQYFTAYALSLVAGRASLIQTSSRVGKRRDASRRRRRRRVCSTRRMTYRRLPLYLALNPRREQLRKLRENRTSVASDPRSTRPTVDYTAALCLTACQKSVYSGYRWGQLLAKPPSYHRAIMEPPRNTYTPD